LLSKLLEAAYFLSFDKGGKMLFLRHKAIWYRCLLENVTGCLRPAHSVHFDMAIDSWIGNLEFIQVENGFSGTSVFLHYFADK
jgi:hypothetical protein